MRWELNLLGNRDFGPSSSWANFGPKENPLAIANIEEVSSQLSPEGTTERESSEPALTLVKRQRGRPGKLKKKECEGGKGRERSEIDQRRERGKRRPTRLPRWHITRTWMKLAGL